MHRRVLPILAVACSAAVAAGCGAESEGSGGSPDKRGPITIWYSNNEQEVAWGQGVVKAWNEAHPTERVTAQEIPAGKTSEEVISAAISAGNAPCLVLNTSPAAVPGFVRQVGLVALDSFPGGAAAIEARTGKELAEQYRSPDGHYYQMPWKSNPVMIVYNKKLVAEAGLDPANPPLRTYAEFLQTAETLVAKTGVQAAIWPAPSGEFFQPWFDFYPLFAAASGGRQLIEDGQAQFDSPAGVDAATFWSEIYKRRLAPQEKYTGDSFADGKAAMAIVGPWAIAVYTDKVEWGVVPVPTKDGLPPDQVYTFADEKSIGLFTACRNQGTAWDFLQLATSVGQDGQLLELTGQMPMRADLAGTYAAYFEAKPAYLPFAEQAARLVEVPSVSNSIEIWQDFRSGYSNAVIFGKKPVADALADLAKQTTELANERG